jgi:hypothetical protein
MLETSILTALSADCQSVWTGISANAPAGNGAPTSAMDAPANIQQKHVVRRQRRRLSHIQWLYQYGSTVMKQINNYDIYCVNIADVSVTLRT